MIRRTFIKALCASPLGFLIPKRKKVPQEPRFKPTGWLDQSGGGCKAAWRDTETNDVYTLSQTYGGGVIWMKHETTSRKYVKKRVEMYRTNYMHL